MRGIGLHSSTGNGYVAGASSKRPWGRCLVLATGDGFAVKEISVNTGHGLSLQSRKHRAEHWVILRGEAEITRGSEVISRGPNDSVFIRVKVKHRIANVGDTVLTFIEVQTGSVLAEDDIERFEDRYGRLGSKRT